MSDNIVLPNECDFSDLLILTGPNPRETHREDHFHGYLLHYSDKSVTAEELAKLLVDALTHYLAPFISNGFMYGVMRDNIQKEISRLLIALELEESFFTEVNNLLLTTVK